MRMSKKILCHLLVAFYLYILFWIFALYHNRYFIFAYKKYRICKLESLAHTSFSLAEPKSSLKSNSYASKLYSTCCTLLLVLLKIVSHYFPLAFYTLILQIIESRLLSLKKSFATSFFNCSSRICRGYICFPLSLSCAFVLACIIAFVFCIWT